MVEGNIVHLKGISKTFGEVNALDSVDFFMKKGEIHGLLGENGAGKSTLMNILYGLYQPSLGEIYIRNEKVKINSPYDSIMQGIGMVHQLSTLVPDFNAVENILMGSRSRKLNFTEAAKKINSMANQFGFTFPLDVKMKELSAGVKQKVEIVRSLYQGASLLIFDEPTTSLVESEFQQLLKSLQHLVAGGVSIILITHKIREVVAACNAVTVLKKGKVQGRLNREEMSKEELVRLMFVEKDIKVTDSALPKINLPHQNKSKCPIYSVRDISLKGGEKTAGLKKVSFDLFGGEIFGIASVTGNGEKDLAYCLTNPSAIEEGEIYLFDKAIKKYDTLSLFREGVFCTPSDRVKEGILPDASIRENILLGHHSEKRFCKNKLFIDWDETRAAARTVIDDFNVATPSEDLEIRRLSGGNIQRVIVGRALLSPISLLIMHNPTAGLDIASVEFVFQQMIRFRSEGNAVIYINEDLDELMLISDRIGVLHQGEICGIFSREDFDKHHIGTLMVGG